jgi:predicted nucleic acid-binding protein
MASGASIDTDVLLKAAAYKVATELVAVLEPWGPPAILGLTHLIAGNQLARKRNVVDRDGAAAELNRLLAMLGSLEPDDDEIALAADLTATAQERALPLDAGEAQLAAIVVRRELPLLVTGDKRALHALAELVKNDPIRPSLVGRLACFEQIVQSVARLIGEEELRERVCAEPAVDGAMRLACSCERPDWDPVQLHEACASFSGAVRSQVGDLLIEGSALA